MVETEVKDSKLDSIKDLALEDLKVSNSELEAELKKREELIKRKEELMKRDQTREAMGGQSSYSVPQPQKTKEQEVDEQAREFLEKLGHKVPANLK